MARRTVANSMLERLAVEICRHGRGIPWEQATRKERAACRLAARGCLMLLREPTEAMRRAAHPKLPHASLEALRVWLAMIGAASNG